MKIDIFTTTVVVLLSLLLAARSQTITTKQVNRATGGGLLEKAPLNNLQGNAYISDAFSTAGISSEQLQVIENTVLTATNLYNLSYTLNSCYNVSSYVSANITKVYGNTWSVFCAIESRGDAYFNIFNNSLVTLIVNSNNVFFRFYVYMSSYSANLMTPSGFLQKQRSLLGDRDNLIGRVFGGLNDIPMLGAANLNETIYIGYGITESMRKTITNLVLNTANQYQLGMNSTSPCNVCEIVSEFINLNVQNYYGPYYSTSVIQQYFGNSYFPFFNGRYLEILITSNGFNYVVTTAWSAY